MAGRSLKSLENLSSLKLISSAWWLHRNSVGKILTSPKAVPDPTRGSKMWQAGHQTLSVVLSCALWTIFESLAVVWNKGPGPFGVAVLEIELKTMSNSRIDFLIHRILLIVNVSVITVHQPSCIVHALSLNVSPALAGGRGRPVSQGDR